MKKTVLVTMPMREGYKERFIACAPDCEVVFEDNACVTAGQVQGADIIIGNPPAKLIQGSERLELLQLISAGADPYIPKGVLAEKTVLATVTGALTKAVAEHTFAMTLTLIKNLHLYRDNQRNRLWQQGGSITSLADSTVLVMGLGDIGLYYARLCKAMGAHIIGIKRRPGECPEGVDELYLTDEADRQLPRADVVASFLPSLPDTRNYFNKARFELMKPSAVLINGGRGDAVDSDALYEALRDGRIRAAGVDVTNPEPLPAEHPLWMQDNMLITPHVAGYYFLDENYGNVVDIVTGNLAAWLRGEPLRNVVDMELGYKK